ncbi:MAG: S8 family serine peptidase [Desulfobacterales bacterium]|nr:MAG: S8 family serine peptidase [Desulfobacterales bacterium]
MKLKKDRISQTSCRFCCWIAIVISIGLLTASLSIAQRDKPRQITEQVVAPDRYIVRLRDYVQDPPAAAHDLARRHRFAVGHVYRRVLRGFSARMPQAVARILERHPDVAYIEPDRKYYAIAQTLPTGVDRMDAGPEFTSSDVDADIAIIDTGIDLTHPDLNVAGSTNCALFGGCLDGGGNDGHGHGTHVAGIAAAMNNDFGVVGVAPGARLWAVRVLDNNGSGWTSWIIAGIDWVTEHAGTIEVANMSLGGQGFSSAMREAIRESVAQGVVYIVAAGNNSQDVYGSDGRFGTSDDFVPAAYPEVAAISALADSDGNAGGMGPATSYGPDDSFATFSNFSRSVTAGNPVSSPGAAIDLLCPGVNIFSTYRNGQYATFSGTSMASPHAAGLAALYIAQNGRPADANGVYAVRQALIDAGIDQDVAEGLAVSSDPDKNPERLGYAGSAEPITDLSLAAIEAPDTVMVGETVNITVTVKNVGIYDVVSTFEVSLAIEDVVTFIPQPINGLPAGQSVDLTFEWNTAGVQAGLYTLTAAVEFTDDKASNNDMAVEVEVREQGLPNTVHIGDLDGSSRNLFWSIWAATVTITVHDTDHNPVPAATVYGVFSDGSSVFQCTTGTNGHCSVQGYQWFLNALTFTTTDVYHVDLDYEPADNHDPDGDSNGTSITVFRP